MGKARRTQSRATQKPGRIQQSGNMGKGWGDSSHYRRNHAGPGQADSYSVVDRREEKVLLNGAERSPRQPNGSGNLLPIIGNQGDVGRFDGDIRSRRSHGDSHVGGSEGRRVVYAVADHRPPRAPAS